MRLYYEIQKKKQLNISALEANKRSKKEKKQNENEIKFLFFSYFFPVLSWLYYHL